MGRIFGRGTRRGAAAGVAAVALFALSACGGSGSGAGPAAGDELPKTIKVVSINPTTGVVAFAGNSANKGYQLAIKEINDTDFLEGSKLELDLKDTKSEPQTAAQEMTKATTGGDISAVFGSVSSNEAVAMSPLAEKQKMPTIYTQAGSDGVVVGDYTWRATPLMREYYTNLTKYLKDSGAKSIGIIYTEATPTLQDIGKNTLPGMAKDLGIEVTASVGTQATTQDFSAPISQILKSKPDIVSILLVGASNPTAMTQLRQAGYDGPVLGNSGASAGNLKPAGADADGMVWAADFNSAMSAESSQTFTKLYQDEYGEAPLNYAAEAYDAAWFLARSLKEAQSADRESIKDAMAKVAESSFDGALGTDLKWVDQDLVVPGVVIEYRDGGEHILYEGSGE
ncbi:ABC transporter substrate-binding protein [Nocardioides nitrophenolicus]|uniref:ABC transporter substrate-binding protein n=1 Tax=Nocardioides nitrophenolicus TaxID=60489 RepID=UPI00195F01DB|nr:ABC transporter substrate-binding protein [Nocardioides nitrophenolicus]MBM7516494.1 branched-chain amino acid transport system substrate-binding protein [Nocardioides nitrophenolicus]